MTPTHTSQHPLLLAKAASWGSCLGEMQCGCFLFLPPHCSQTQKDLIHKPAIERLLEMQIASKWILLFKHQHCIFPMRAAKPAGGPEELMSAFKGSRTWGWQPSRRLAPLGICRCQASGFLSRRGCMMTPAPPLSSFHWVPH